MWKKKYGTCLEVASVPALRSGSTFLKLLDWELSWRLHWSRDMTLRSGSNHCSEMRVWRICHGVDLGRVEFSEERQEPSALESWEGRGGCLTNSLIFLYFSSSVCSVWCLALQGVVGLRLTTQTCFAVTLHRQLRCQQMNFLHTYSELSTLRSDLPASPHSILTTTPWMNWPFTAKICWALTLCYACCGPRI